MPPTHAQETCTKTCTSGHAQETCTSVTLSCASFLLYEFFKRDISGLIPLIYPAQAQCIGYVIQFAVLQFFIESLSVLNTCVEFISLRRNFYLHKIDSLKAQSCTYKLNDAYTACKPASCLHDSITSFLPSTSVISRLRYSSPSFDNPREQKSLNHL